MNPIAPEKTDCPVCGTHGAYTPPVWPAFYEAGPGHILWIGFGGSVLNGGWKPDFSEDRLTCWPPGNSEHVFRRVASAPSSGDYNKVIEAFRRQRVQTGGAD